LDGDSWTNVMTGGFGYATNRYVKTMVEFNGYLYAGSGMTRAEIWRSQNGTTWTSVTTTGFGDANNVLTLDFCKFRGYLYVVMANAVSGMQVFRSLDGTNFEAVITDGFGDATNVGSVSSQKIIISFNDYLYVGTAKGSGGCEIWRSLNGTSFTSVITDGFGDILNQRVVGFAKYRNYLYAAVMYNGASTTGTGTEVWRTQTGSQQSDWAQVNDDGFGLHPTYNVYPTGPWVCGDYLYVLNRVYLVDLCTAYRTQVGAQMSDWSIANVPGFGLDGEVNADVRAMIDFKGHTYMCACTTGPDANGFRIYRLHSGVASITGSISATGLYLPSIKIADENISVPEIISQHISAQSIGTSGIMSAGTMILAPAPVQAITAVSDTVTAAGSLLTLNPDANYTLTSTPTIPDGATGQILLIQVANGEANTITLQDQSVLPLSNLRLQSNTRIISAVNPLRLYFDGSDWVEETEAIQISKTVNQETVATVSGEQIGVTIQADETSTGVDEAYGSIWEAIKITATTSANIGSFAVKIKASASLSNPTAYISGFLYSNVTGLPGTLIGGTTTIDYSALTTSFVEQIFNVSTSIVSGTVYWLVLKQSAAPTGGTISLDSGLVGTGVHAYSTDGVTWIAEDNKKCWNKIYGRCGYGVRGSSTSSYGVYGSSTSSYGVRGSSTSSYGVYGSSTSSYGVYGFSTSSYGVHGSSTSSYGVYGSSTSSYGVRGFSTSSYGVYGSSTSSWGVYGFSTSSYGVYGSSTSSYGVYGSSTSSYGVRGSSTSGIGAYITINPPSLDTIAEVLRIHRQTSDIAAVGIGGSIDFHIEGGSGGDIAASRIGSVLTAVDAGIETSDINFYTKLAGGAVAEVARITGAGQLSLNNPTPNASAIISAVSTTMGLLPPVMTSTQRAAIMTPAEGLIVYDVTLHKLTVFTTVWEAITSVPI
jgi:hypothetical protein